MTRTVHGFQGIFLLFNIKLEHVFLQYSRITIWSRQNRLRYCIFLYKIWDIFTSSANNLTAKVAVTKTTRASLSRCHRFAVWTNKGHNSKISHSAQLNSSHWFFYDNNNADTGVITMPWLFFFQRNSRDKSGQTFAVWSPDTDYEATSKSIVQYINEQIVEERQISYFS